ncbi:hypothetical protein PAXRUDRAFT_36773 [Paxillus rubicundulus Ve08.2h10]|uniref:Uncharacterized protein n=1 Tax=Paxillus rubicundulus Ve08.2h10 TaxID=930991 RepID=A0A0D0DAL6_9AGAM|nr:hypothetical protein PAXRUDRAFT_36773 [Paxillus rubicundulus Ve08.2h10]
MNDFFAHNKDVNHQALCHKCTFIYQDMDTPLLATIHIHANISHIDVPSFNMKKLALCGVSGALSVSCAATSQQLNEAMGKESMTKYAFSAQNWKSATSGYFYSVSARGDDRVHLQVIESMSQNILAICGTDSVDKYLGEPQDNYEFPA